MNARKHRQLKQAKEADRLGPKRYAARWDTADRSHANKWRPVHRADLNHSSYSLQNMEKLPTSPGLATGQTLPQGVSGGAAWRGPKKPTPGRNVLDKPTSVWSHLARESAEPPLERTANDS